MTIEEKARKLQWTFYHGTGGDESELQFLARLLREWIEEEREACAKIAKQVAEEQRPELAEAYKMRASIRGALHEGRIEAAERIESQIRARSS